MRQTSKTQKVCFVIAILSYIAAVGCIGAVIYYSNTLGGDHPYTASFGAAVVFFVGAGIVLHVIGKVDIPDLSMKSRSHDGDEDNPT